LPCPTDPSIRRLGAERETQLSPRKTRLCWDQRGIFADHLSGTAVLEYGPTEISPPVGAP
jgi:hypothetical protein